MVTIKLINPRGGYARWWLNICDYLGTTDNDIDECTEEKELINLYGGGLCIEHENSFFEAYVAFKNERDMTAFLLRWS